jgi:hypothetical protein
VVRGFERGIMPSVPGQEATEKAMTARDQQTVAGRPRAPNEIVEAATIGERCARERSFAFDDLGAQRRGVDAASRRAQHRHRVTVRTRQSRAVAPERARWCIAGPDAMIIVPHDANLFRNSQRSDRSGDVRRP